MLQPKYTAHPITNHTANRSQVSGLSRLISQSENL